MDQTVTQFAGAIAVAFVVAWLNYVFRNRHEQLKEIRARNLEAAVGLAAAMREFQVLVRAYGREPVAKAEVISLFSSWAVASDHYRHRLPDTWRHLPHSVRDATGTVFGGVSLVHIRPDAAQLDLASPDAMWQDYADDYLDYAAACLNVWGHDSAMPRPVPLASYDQWLRRSGRIAPSIAS